MLKYGVKKDSGQVLKLLKLNDQSEISAS